MNSKFFLTLFMFFCFSSISYAEPNKEETALFIKKKTSLVRYWDKEVGYGDDKNTQQCVGDIMYEKEVIFSQDFCHIEVIKNVYNNSEGNCKGGVSHYYSKSINLKDIDPDTGKIFTSGETVHFGVFEGKKLVKHYEEYFEGNYPGKKPEGKQRVSASEYASTGIYISTYNGDKNSPKLLKAMTHLIKLCGGKSELF